MLRSQINELLSSFHFSLISSDWKFLSTHHQVGSKLFAELLVLKNKAKLLPKLFVLSSVEDGIRLRACYLRSSLIVASFSFLFSVKRVWTIFNDRSATTCTKIVNTDEKQSFSRWHNTKNWSVFKREKLETISCRRSELQWLRKWITNDSRYPAKSSPLQVKIDWFFSTYHQFLVP